MHPRHRVLQPRLILLARREAEVLLRFIGREEPEARVCHYPYADEDARAGREGEVGSGE